MRKEKGVPYIHETSRSWLQGKILNPEKINNSDILIITDRHPVNNLTRLTSFNIF